MIDVQELTDLEVDRRIGDLKEKLGSKLFMPVHHYQRDEIVQFADYTGDSLGLSRISADTNARFIVFCGVYFMAEIARVLASEDKYVFIPNRNAGCPLADLASEEEVVRLWNVLQSTHPGEYIPVTYANSHAAIKAFCGKNNGLVCTSSNVESIFRWILDGGKRVYFMPDKNLGINTAAAMGLESDHWVAGAGVEWKEEAVRGKKIILWDGYCIVHKVFTLQHVEYWRKRDPSIKIIVHPECEPEVVRASDYSGSTSKIKKMVEESPSGSQWVIGTEFNLVNRLNNDNPDKLVEPLDKSVCVNMSKIKRRDLLKILLSIDNGDYSDQVVLPPDQVADAKKAIDKMLEIS
jgi:quinolinate synthase